MFIRLELYSMNLLIIGYRIEEQESIPLTAKGYPEFIKALENLKVKPIQCPPLTQEGPEQIKRELETLISRMLSYSEELRPGWDELITSPLIGQEYFRQVVNEDQIMRSERVNHLVTIFLAKAELALSLSQTLNQELPKVLPSFSDFHKSLIQACLIGYSYKILLNAFGYCFNNINFICEAIRNYINMISLTLALKEYQADKSDYTSQIKAKISLQIEKSKDAYNLAEDKVYQLKKNNIYPHSITNFYKLISIVESTEFLIYGKWFQFFWREELKNQLIYDSSRNYEIGYLKQSSY